MRNPARAQLKIPPLLFVTTRKQEERQQGFSAYIVGRNDQLDDVLRVLIQDFHRSPGNECSKILWKEEDENSLHTFGLKQKQETTVCLCVLPYK